MELAESDTSNWGDRGVPVKPHQILIESRALDSYHNVLFSLTLFYTQFNAWPRHMTIVSHEFKESRLREHCRAIGWPEDKTSFIGIDPPGMAAGEADKAGALKGVSEAVGDWLSDPHGRGEKLRGKRMKRNPWVTWQGVFCQDVQESSGLKTVGTGDEETLVDDAPRPWDVSV